MRAIDCDKIIGIKVWENEDEYSTLLYRLSRAPIKNNSYRAIEFKSLKDVDKFINGLKKAKKDFIALQNNQHL